MAHSTRLAWFQRLFLGDVPEGVPANPGTTAFIAYGN
jgi:hypothetical protein